MMRRHYVVAGAVIVASVALWLWRHPVPSVLAPSTSQPDTGHTERSAALATGLTGQPLPPPSGDHENQDGSTTGQDGTDRIASLNPEDAENRIEQLSTMLENATADELRAALHQAFERADDVMLNAARNHLLVRAKAGNGAATVALVAGLDTAEPALQEYLVRTLGEIATTDALRALIDIASHTHAVHDRAERAALQAIAEVGEWRDENVPAADLSVLLERYFSTLSPGETEAIAAAARGLSTLGTAQGVSQVMQTFEQLQREGSGSTELRSRLSEALTEVRNPEAVPVLSSRLQEDSGLTGEISRVAGHALAAMGDPRATQALLDWAAGIVDEPSGKQAVTWLSSIRDPRSLEILLQIGHRDDFRNPALKQSLAALAQELRQREMPSLSP